MLLRIHIQWAYLPVALGIEDTLPLWSLFQMRHFSNQYQACLEAFLKLSVCDFARGKLHCKCRWTSFCKESKSSVNYPLQVLSLLERLSLAKPGVCEHSDVRPKPEGPPGFLLTLTLHWQFLPALLQNTRESESSVPLHCPVFSHYHYPSPGLVHCLPAIYLLPPLPMNSVLLSGARMIF